MCDKKIIASRLNNYIEIIYSGLSVAYSFGNLALDQHCIVSSIYRVMYVLLVSNWQVYSKLLSDYLFAWTFLKLRVMI